MTTKHTPGPWQAQDYWIIGCVEDSWDIMAGADTACPKRVAKVFTSEADARLIAAAPETAAERDRLKEVNAELLEALKTFPGFTDDATVGDDWLEKALAAIAKAEGRE